uniref:Rap-GAP domain-containing protein n=1 Tax=Arcella intermedia TaxID=1963864 RepID=A0A6B2L7D2_9EUKA
MIEPGNSQFKISKMNEGSFIIENSDNDCAWFTNNFAEFEHYSYLGRDKILGPFCIIVKKLPEENGEFLALLKSKKEDKTTVIADTKKSKKKKPTRDFLLKSLNINTSKQNLKRIKDPRFTQDLIQLEKKLIMKQLKIGVLYCKEGQEDEREIFANEYPSDEFKHFLKFLGKKTPLKGFTGFAGGLDTSSDTETGENAITTVWKGHELLFHTSTMIPISLDDPQQLQRKRHIGNDIVLIVFKEGNNPYSPGTVTSSFNHVIIVVQPVPYKDGIWYRMSVASKTAVPSFGPELPEPPLFPSSNLFREFLLTKVINAERAAYKAVPFSTKMANTKLGLLTNLEHTYGQPKV